MCSGAAATELDGAAHESAHGVLIGAGAKILGNITIGEGAKVGAGSIVLDSVAPFTTVVGVPARPIARNAAMAALTMDQTWPHDHDRTG